MNSTFLPFIVPCADVFLELGICYFWISYSLTPLLVRVQGFTHYSLKTLTFFFPFNLVVFKISRLIFPLLRDDTTNHFATTSLRKPEVTYLFLVQMWGKCKFLNNLGIAITLWHMSWPMDQEDLKFNIRVQYLVVFASPFLFYSISNRCL